MFGEASGNAKQRGSIAFNENLHKMLMVIVFLSDEMKELKEIAEAKFYDPLIMFGNHPMEMESNILEREKDNRDRENDFRSIPSGEREKMVGKILPLLQELSNFIDRCYAVVVNVVQQLSSLMNNNNKEGKSLYMAGQAVATSSGSTIRPFFILFQGLGDILTVLITFDLIIRQVSLIF